MPHISPKCNGFHPLRNPLSAKLQWQETALQLKQLYRLESNVHRRIRLQALWHLRCGKRIQDVVEMIGVCYRTVQNWAAWYRQGGLAEVLSRIPGLEPRQNLRFAALLTKLQVSARQLLPR